MPQRKTILTICLLLLASCLTTGYWMAEQQIGAVAALLLGPAWFLARKYPASWLPLVCLLASVGLSAAGILFGVPPVLMIVGSAMALAAWDLLLLHTALGSQSVSEQARQYENKHLRSLVIAVGFGLLIGLIGRSFSVHIPFIVLLLLIIFILFALDRVWGYLKKAGRL